MRPVPAMLPQRHQKPMGPRTFSNHYCVCIQDDGTPREISRLGSIVTYKAIDYRSGRPVALQVIPLTSIDQSVRQRFQEQARSAQKLDHVNVAKVFTVGVEDEHIIFATEYLQGETADAWIVAHGPMTPDAVVRVGLQVVSALGAAIFHGLTHRSIQPSNLMIVSGSTPEGDWPFIKLLNFGLVGLKLYSEGSEPREFAPSIAPLFASPEQLQDRTVDFRSEIFSLGATMCFLLTGAVPLAGVPGNNRVTERILPSPGQIPRPLRKILKQMLRHNPEERPQDPVVFTEELRRCLQKVSNRSRIEPRSAIGLAPTLEPVIEDRRSRALPIGLAFAAVLGTLAILSAILMPERWQSLLTRNRDISTLGVPIGVPDTASTAGDKSSSAQSASSQPAQARAGLASNTKADASGSFYAPAVPPSATPRIPENGSANLTIPPAVAEHTETAIAANPTVVNRTPNSPPGQQQSGTPLVTLPRSNSENVGPASGSPPQIAANKTGAEPPPPAEGPSASPQEGSTRDQSVAAQNSVGANATPAETNGEIRTPQDVWNSLRSNADKGTTEASPTAAAKSRAESKGSASRKKTKSSRDQRVASSRHRPLPQMRVGSMRAEFVGTTQDGSWILQLPNGKTVVTPPIPNINDVPVEHHRVRRAVPVPRAEVPPDQRPPVVVLPPDT